MSRFLKLKPMLRRGTLAVALAAVNAARADHGPGTSGGGASTQSGETLKPGKFAVEVREDFTQFENLSESEINAKAASAGSIDLLDNCYLTTLGVSYGILENFQASLTIGYYAAVHPSETEFNPETGQTTVATFNPNGLTDMWLTGKYRFYHGPAGSMAVIGGAKFPTGKSDVINSEGEPVEPSATAGSGSYDGLFGLAYSRFLTAQLTLDASAGYTLRTEANDFKLGDRIDGGIALAYRLTKDIQKYPQVSLFTEANVRYLYESLDGGEPDGNTGGTAVFITPGFRVAFSRNLSVTVAAPLPVFQNLNGEQLRTAYKISGGLTLSF